MAQRAFDIDLVYVDGYGLLASRGGPIFEADSLGLPQVLARITALQGQQGEHWRPSALPQRLADEGGRFSA
ncbi:hypothetical protein MHZ93_08065 [Roseomonas sp. ACRSG]|nr:hypothetical protein [Roseomonas sp. ACRSG]